MERENKKIVLLMHNGGRLGNQLWWIAAFYAYCLEKKYIFDVRCFFEYQEYFNVKIESIFSKILGKIYFLFEYVGMPEESRRDLFYTFYNFFVKCFAFFKGDVFVFDSYYSQQNSLRKKSFLIRVYHVLLRLVRNIFKSDSEINKEAAPLYAKQYDLGITLLPPSSESDLVKNKNTYFCGWFFRNPNGIIKFQKEITKFLTPKASIENKVNNYVHGLRKEFEHVVGVHIRLGDVVQEFINNDRVAYREEEVYSILKDFLIFSNYDVKNTCFVICSDGEIDKIKFKELKIKITKNNPVEDLWLLSKTDYIIGADSSFAIMASFFGDKPFIVFKRGGIDWGYYKDKKKFFVNKYVARFVY